ncbi:(2Fe-2S)-binding protein [Dyella mobilis]|uniref:(2Fe-2S)-binding protein n=1 Tax=Dyella mobilis TaxID=1849582 RepID=A0ABS2KMV5_9GAMM|nr:(2Fe-2S)-binding protein [Dyella mobilis]MBM7132223.1 (2Fe-2S)-binding protein [Dyella mobilis]GLQ95791.1 (2Fe-2S)-binding protein [Dyella mobilis]
MAQDHAVPAQTGEITPVAIRPGIDLEINGERYRHTGDPQMPLLWYLREVLRLDGTKYAGEHGEGGSDLVLVNGKAVSSIGVPMSKLSGKQVVTVEGLADSKGKLHPLQQAFIDEDAIGCGYCTPGWLIASMDLLNRHKDPNDGDIDTLPNLCRCGCQTRVRSAIKRAAGVMKQGAKA